jgi:hypothetical protein
VFAGFGEGLGIEYPLMTCSSTLIEGLLGKVEFNFPERSEWAKAHPSRCTAYLVSGAFAANGAIYFPSMFL